MVALELLEHLEITFGDCVLFGLGFLSTFSGALRGAGAWIRGFGTLDLLTQVVKMHIRKLEAAFMLF